MDIRPDKAGPFFNSALSSKTFGGLASREEAATTRSMPAMLTVLVEGIDGEAGEEGPRRSSATGRRRGGVTRSVASLFSKLLDGDTPDQSRAEERKRPDGRAEDGKGGKERGPVGPGGAPPPRRAGAPSTSAPSPRPLDGWTSRDSDPAARQRPEVPAVPAEGIDGELGEGGPRRSSATDRRGSGGSPRAGGGHGSRLVGRDLAGPQGQPRAEERKYPDGRADNGEGGAERRLAGGGETSPRRRIRPAEVGQPADVAGVSEPAAREAAAPETEPVAHPVLPVPTTRSKIPPDLREPIKGQVQSPANAGGRDQGPAASLGREGWGRRRLELAQMEVWMGGTRLAQGEDRGGPGRPFLRPGLGKGLTILAGQVQSAILALLHHLTAGPPPRTGAGHPAFERRSPGVASKRKARPSKDLPALFKKALAFQWNSEASSREDLAEASPDRNRDDQPVLDLTGGESDLFGRASGVVGDLDPLGPSEAAPGVLKAGPNQPIERDALGASGDGPGDPGPAVGVPHPRSSTADPVRPTSGDDGMAASRRMRRE